MLDQTNHFVGPTRGVVDRQFAAVNHQKFVHRNEGSSFITLLECMRLGETNQQSHREHDNVLFTISKCVLRTRHRAVQQSWISQEMPLPGHRDDRAIDFDDYLDWQPPGLIWQAPPKSLRNGR